MSNKHKNYQVVDVVNSLNKKPGVRVLPNFSTGVGGVVEIDRKYLEIGIGSKGKIDFLTNHKNFVISYV